MTIHPFGSAREMVEPLCDLAVSPGSAGTPQQKASSDEGEDANSRAGGHSAKKPGS